MEAGRQEASLLISPLTGVGAAEGSPTTYLCLEPGCDVEANGRSYSYLLRAVEDSNSKARAWGGFAVHLGLEPGCDVEANGRS